MLQHSVGIAWLHLLLLNALEEKNTTKDEQTLLSTYSQEFGMKRSSGSESCFESMALGDMENSRLSSNLIIVDWLVGKRLAPTPLKSPFLSFKTEIYL